MASRARSSRASSRSVRVGPVHFQSLESELLPVVQFLRGPVLDAGCGSRDLTDFLLGQAASRVTRYDLASDDSQVVLGTLEAMPFPDETFDAALCNAVLEHVADVVPALHELARVVKPGGHLVVAVPFLQPYHPCPGDYRRYTADGLAQLGCGAGFEVVAILPVHSVAQTLGWIAWECAQEKGGRLRQGVTWWAVYALTRWWSATDPAISRNANTFQAVFRRPSRVREE